MPANLPPRQIAEATHVVFPAPSHYLVQLPPPPPHAPTLAELAASNAPLSSSQRRRVERWKKRNAGYLADLAAAAAAGAGAAGMGSTTDAGGVADVTVTGTNTGDGSSVSAGSTTVPPAPSTAVSSAVPSAAVPPSVEPSPSPDDDGSASDASYGDRDDDSGVPSEPAVAPEVILEGNRRLAAILEYLAALPTFGLPRFHRTSRYVVVALGHGAVGPFVVRATPYWIFAPVFFYILELVLCRSSSVGCNRKTAT